MNTKGNKTTLAHATIIVLLLLVFPACLTAAVPTGPEPQAVAEVESKSKEQEQEQEGDEARASWWGFNLEDATAALQAAINSGARRLIVEDMGTPWIVDRLTLASNQEIIFEKGVVVQAKRGAFHGGGDCLFSAASKRNITLIGPGATLRMWKQDYDDKTQYKHAEWRHVLSFTSCARVRVEGLRLADSGGDGIYLGVARKGVPCSDVVITNVTCVNNYRQGISVISARNLLIEDCTLKDTGGTAPQAGIDFEPNEATEELVNCVMRNCVSENNKGDAFTFYLRQLRADSKPVSIRLEHCRAFGCRRSVAFVTGNDSETAGVKGKAAFFDCRFEGSKQAGISIGDKPVAGVRMRFEDCQIIDPAASEPGSSPIEFASGANSVGAIGRVALDRCVIQDTQDRLPMSYQDRSGGVGLSDITGTLTLRRGTQEKAYRLTPELIARWMPFRSFKQFSRIDTTGWRYEPVLPTSEREPSPHSIVRLRGASEWLLWAEAGEQVQFTVLVRPVGKGDSKHTPVSLISPSGKLTRMAAATGEKETAYDFKAAERGAFRIVCEAGNWTATVNSPRHRLSLYAPNAPFHLLGTTGRFWFRVPAGTKEFGVKVSGGGGTECVKVALYDAAGHKVEEKDSIGRAHQFLVTRKHSAQGEIWSLRFDKPGTGVLEDFYVQLQGIAPLLSPTREGLLRRAN